MASRARTKRLAREVPELRKKNNNYFVNINDEDLTSFHAYIIGPDDSCYAGKLVKLKIQVPVDYPYKPPQCTFIQQKGGRIHPNLYNQGGKVCLSILGTFPGPGWAFTMTIDTVLITIQSLLDAKPLMHEPGQQDSKPYNDYVRYTTWRWLLLDYIDSETDVSNKIFLQSFLKEQGPRIWQQLQKDKNVLGNSKFVSAMYERSGKRETVDWPKVESDVRSAIVTAGGSIFAGAGEALSSGEVLSSGQLPSGSSIATEIIPTSLAMETPREKRKLDALDPDTSRMDPAKKPASNTEHAPICPPQKTKAKSSPRKKCDVIDLSNDEEPAQESFHDDRAPRGSEVPSSSSQNRRAREEKSSTSRKPQEVIIIDDD